MDREKGLNNYKSLRDNNRNRCFVCNQLGHWRNDCPHAGQGERHSTNEQRNETIVGSLRMYRLQQEGGQFDESLNTYNNTPMLVKSSWVGDIKKPITMDTG